MPEIDRVALAGVLAMERINPGVEGFYWRCPRGRGLEDRIASLARASILAIRARSRGYARAIHDAGKNQRSPHSFGVMPTFAAASITTSSSPALAAGAQATPSKPQPNVRSHSGVAAGSGATNQTTPPSPDDLRTRLLLMPLLRFHRSHAASQGALATRPKPATGLHAPLRRCARSWLRRHPLCGSSPLQRCAWPAPRPSR